jgi:hydroxypyruvate isomerase
MLFRYPQELDANRGTVCERDRIMPRFAANVSMMFTELPFLDRFAAAADAGFQAVEFVSPYEHPPGAIEREAKSAGLIVSLFNLPPGNWGAGDRGITCHPGRELEFRISVDTALAHAKRFGTENLHAMAGIVPKDIDASQCRATLIENLKYAAEKLAENNITLLLEAINTRDMPGYLVSTQAACHSICLAVDADNLKMQMDCYHMQVMEGDLATKLRQYAALCGHIQIASCPERAEPDLGEIRYEYLFRLIDELGYAGWIGCEYRPATNTLEGLGWLREIASPAN